MLLAVDSTLKRAEDPGGPGSRQSRGESGSAACCAESLWLSGAERLSFLPRLGWKAQPSSRVGGISEGRTRKGEAFPQSRRRSRFESLPFGDFDATLRSRTRSGTRGRGRTRWSKPSGSKLGLYGVGLPRPLSMLWMTSGDGKSRPYRRDWVCEWSPGLSKRALRWRGATFPARVSPLHE
jgi:hypothetical protein